MVALEKFRYLLTSLFLVTVAQATPNDVFGLSPERQGVAGGTVSRSSGGDVAQNPALLVDADASLGISLTTVFDRTSILLMPRPEGYDPKDYALLSRERSDTQGSEILLTVDGQFTLISDRLALGFAFAISGEGVGSIVGAYADENAQYFDNQLHFARYSRRLTADVFSAGLGYRFRQILRLVSVLSCYPGFRRTIVFIRQMH